MEKGRKKMREILFRGNRLDNGKWVYGSFCMDARELLKGLCGVDGFIRRYEPNKGQVQMYEVDRQTVGQFTGLTDKNGKRIFEGDIVEFCDIKGVINYNTGCFCVKTNKPDWKSRNNPAIDIVLCEYENEVEVIGNIHDNPELIGERKDNESVVG